MSYPAIAVRREMDMTRTVGLRWEFMDTDTTADDVELWVWCLPWWAIRHLALGPIEEGEHDEDHDDGDCRACAVLDQFVMGGWNHPASAAASRLKGFHMRDEEFFRDRGARRAALGGDYRVATRDQVARQSLLGDRYAGVDLTQPPIVQGEGLESYLRTLLIYQAAGWDGRLHDGQWHRNEWGGVSWHDLEPTSEHTQPEQALIGTDDLPFRDARASPRGRAREGAKG